VDTRVIDPAVLRQTLAAARRDDRGWGYYAGNASRLEPTCWALLAFGGGDPDPDRGAFLARAQQSTGWLLERPEWPINIGFNGLVAFTWLADVALSTDAGRRQLLAALIDSKGIQTPQTDYLRQDNSLQGWSWIDSSFSWVEPTCWGLLALKKARSGASSAAARARIAEAERLLIDRCCRDGGWNYGNAEVMGQTLRPHGPTSALGLLALQDRRDEPAVRRSLAYLEQHGADETSAVALGLALICLDVYGRPLDRVAARLRDHVEDARAFGNLHGVALALFALTRTGQGNVFRI
jgi:hypothetical protein